MSTATGVSRSPGLEQLRVFVAGTSLRRGITVFAVLVFLQVVMFWQFYAGIGIPPYDFLGAYAGDAFVWWTDGAFFAPPEWIPYVWGGYPSASGLQNSAWYLPTGIVAMFGTYNLHAAAILAAIHVAFGACGMYLLLRAFRVDFFISLFGAVALFFGVGFFSNASHIDIARAYAWLPWVLWILTPLWPWRKWWSIPLASLLLWQAITGIYPGIAVSSVYVLIPWILMLSLVFKPKFSEYVLPAALAGVTALLLSMPRVLPYLLLNDGSSEPAPEASLFSGSVLGTMLFGYRYDYDIPNDLTMRSLFVPVTVIVLALFARWSDPICKVAFALVGPAVLLGMPFWPWFSAVQHLPGLQLSRFSMSDFKVFMVVGAILLAVSGLRTLCSRARVARPALGLVLSIATAWVILLGFTVLAIRGPQAKVDTVPPLLLLATAVSLVTAYVAFDVVASRQQSLAAARCRAREVLVASVIVLTGVSGAVWAYGTAGPWLVDRVPAEMAAYGATVDELVAARQARPTGLAQRPARAAVQSGFEQADLYASQGNAAFFNGEYSLPGYVNLKRSESHVALMEALLDPNIGPYFADFMAMPGAMLATESDGLVELEALRSCTERYDCGIDVTPVAYDVDRFVYRVDVLDQTTVTLNEAFFPGWKATACVTAEQCHTLRVTGSEAGTIMLDLPAGQYDVTLQYEAPGRKTAWLLFSSGVLLAAVSAATTFLFSRREKVSSK